MNRLASSRRFTVGEACQRTIDAERGHGLPVVSALPICRVAGKPCGGAALRSAGLFLDVVPETCAGQHLQAAGRARSPAERFHGGAATHASDTSRVHA